MNAGRPIANTTTDTAAHPAKCAYRSKPCPNTRAIKMNGEFHRLCEYHRRRANLNQQRVHQRRKLREMHKKQHEQAHQPRFFVTAAPYPLPTFAWASGLSSPTSADKCYDEEILGDSDLAFNFELDCEPSLSPCGDLPLPDLEILERLLSSDADSSSWSALAEACQPECRAEFFELDFSKV